EELNSFYNIYKNKFNNKTNGITFRRWLLSCNESLSSYIEDLIGGDFIKDYNKLSKLYDYKDNKEVLNKIGEIKKSNKINFKNYLLNTQNISIDENSIFDIQIKRFHEYKRQQMNLLYLIYKYLEIKKGKKPATPITTIFGGKAAPAYIIAQDIIHAILCLSEVINNDTEVNKLLKVVMIENYNVTSASKVIPACDVSEQISLASKEASGTGNMKFMLNGAVTLGTEDGANVEIMDLVGKDNIYIFGEKSSDVISHYKNRDYNSRNYYYKGLIKPLIDFIVSDEMIKVGDSTSLYRLFNELINKDWFMTLLDLEDYIKIKEKVFKDYEDREAWNRKALINISKAGFFSSDRTIEEYNKDIWKLK
ncbi:MAG: glycogen/starch/alpha-glucan phosphorylase, partial [Clostridium sp.]|uniref:glycogen/starch/alpha-glucan phosphorylase n=1 Tax=Clostridium sp. TaxID=1506 RepID=UPI00290DDF81